MGKINVLTSDISNKIAAGEVVERPLSVVKELVENSIDAGATSICVEIRNGGTVLIRVTDNGSGMSAEDAQIAFLRHATSKISTEQDLDAIYTLGFRGEALSSIGAVAHVSLYTKQKDSQYGIHVMCDGGEIIASDESGVADGTTFLVENLFFNTPARMKFLKKDATEFGYISDIISKFILSHPEISFTLINNGKQTLKSPGDGNLMNAVYVVYGRDYARAVIPVDYSSNSVHVTGVVGKNTLMRPNRSFESFFVNKRYIKSPILMGAVEEAYKNQMMAGKFPVAVLNLEINPASIDINVHPTKLEVKFSRDKEVYEAVYYGVLGALYQKTNIPTIEKDQNQSIHTPKPHSAQLPIKEPEEKKPENKVPVEEKTKNCEALPIIENKQAVHEMAKADNEAVADKKELVTEAKKAVITQAPIIDPLAQFRKKDENAFKLCEPEVTFRQEEIKAPEPVEETATEHQMTIDDLTIVGQVFSTYIITEYNNEMLIFDQHAAHERLKYEALLADMKGNAVYSQMLIEGVVTRLSGREMSIFEQNANYLNKLGFCAERFGEGEVIIRSAPSEVSTDDIDDLFVELLDQIGNDKQEIQPKKQEKLLYTIACKSAIKANHSLNNVEMTSLVKGVLELSHINTCPHGRPIIIKMTKKEIEKQFKRIV